ncbi:MAG TPA: hypothetical protein VFM09_00880, partial [Marmoricola sp.]|nr:hypothetical protein [Marmoricola sp.]
MTRAGAGLAGAVAGLLLVAGCSLPGSGPQPSDALAALAGALDHGRPGRAPWVDPAAARRGWAAVTADVQQLPVSVTAGRVTAGDHPRGTLHWSWQVAGRTWRYDTTVGLVRRGDA